MGSDCTNLPWACSPAVHQGERVLAVQLGLTVDEAVQVLRDRATAGGNTVLDAAAHVVTELVQARYKAKHLGPLDPWGSC